MNHKPFVLVVEDDASLGPLYVEILEILHGWQAEWIDDGSQAEARLAALVPDIILLDLHLPGVSGEQLFRSIRRDARFKETKLVILSADGIRAKELEARADLVLLKPVGHQKLAELPFLLDVEVFQ